MRNYLFLFIITALSVLQPIVIFASAEIAGTITAKRGDRLKVEFQTHETAMPKIGDEVEFSTTISGISMPAGVGKITEVGENFVWVQTDDNRPDLRMKATIHATVSPQASYSHADTEIAGTITAKRDDTVKVEFQAHKTAEPKIGDNVRFSGTYEGMLISAGSGKVSEVGENFVWVIAEKNLKPGMKAVIYATGMLGSHVNKKGTAETITGKAIDSRTASKPPVTREGLLLVLSTSEGTISIELNKKKAPETVKNIISYASEGYYDGTIFHRVIQGFMIQGGGFTSDMKKKHTHPPIVNEADNGLKNLRGTIAMARTKDPDSATSQFFINTADNESQDFKSKSKKGWGYCVFGKVVEGMDVVDAIGSVETTRFKKYRDVPKQPVIIRRAYIR